MPTILDEEVEPTVNPESMTLKRGGRTRSVVRAAGLVVAAGLLSLPVYAQGILTVTPAGTIGVTAGTGTLGYAGDGAAATGATLASPSAVAFDAAGNIYVADTRNHVVRKVAPGGNITTIAGTGTEGFSGDNGTATSAQLDTPTGVAVDAAGNVYIADAKNNRVRKVTGTTITTIAGTGAAGFSGDGGAATSALLALPSGVAVDGSGNVYVADTNNERVRKITGTTISTLAGSGVQGFAGDGAAATAAALDSPVGVAVDGSGNVYVADRHNQRIRVVAAASGIISTVAGGTSSFSGGFGGDGAAAAAATLAHPSGISVDAAGNLYIADTNNQRVRKITGTTIATVVGNGVQGAPAAGNAPTSTALNSPAGAIGDSLGNVVIADKLNETITGAGSAYMTYAAQTVGTTSAGKTVILSNTGTANITVTAPTYTGPFVTVSGGTCVFPQTITAGNNCTVLVGYMPTAAGTQSGTATYSGTNVVSSTMQLAGTGTAVTPTKLVFTSGPATPIAAGGNAGTVQVALEDAGGNVATSSSSTVTLTVSGPNGYLQTYQQNAINGVAAFNLSSVALTVAQTYTYTAAAMGLTNGVATEVVNPGAAAALVVTGLGTFTAPQMSGTATVEALDGYGNVVTGFTGTVTLTSTDAAASYSPASYTYTAADAGVHTFTITFDTAGNQTLAATSGALTGSESGVLVEDAVWILNASDALTRLTDAGVQTTAAGAGGGTSGLGAVAFDHAGNVWVTQQDANTVAKYSAAGAAVVSTGGGGISAPVSLFVDGAGQVWIANAGSASISLLSNGGGVVSPGTGYQAGSLSGPTGIVVDNSGSVWVTNGGAGTVVKVFGAAVPVVAPVVVGTVNHSLGTAP